MTEQKLLSEWKKEWKIVHGKLWELLERLNDNELALSCPDQTFGTIGKQIRHILDVYDVYIRAIAYKNIDFSIMRKETTIEFDKDRLMDYAQFLDDQLINILDQLDDSNLFDKISWKDSDAEDITLFNLLSLILHHETYHFGIINITLKNNGKDIIALY